VISKLAWHCLHALCTLLLYTPLMATPSNDITPKILLDHMQGMEHRIMERFLQVDGRFIQVDTRLDGIDRKLDIITVQTQNIDERLDDIEVVQLPKIRKAVGMA